MDVSKCEYKMLKTMVDDLMNAESFINCIGVETRIGVPKDEFRPIYEILKDIVILVNNNPTIIDDAIGKSFDTTDEMEEFISRYNLDGVTANYND